MTTRPARALLLASILICGCPKPKPPPPTPTCVTTGQICGTVNGTVCGVCPNDGVCATNGLSCIPSLAIGAACTTNIECGENRTCLEIDNGFQTPNGYCTKPCSPSEMCPTGATCGTDSKGDSVCLTSCTDNSACRVSDGYTCSNDTCAACVPDCMNKTCGNDGCGGECGTAVAGTPVCDLTGQVCASNQCAPAFTVVSTLSRPPNGLWDAAAFDRSGQALVVGGREVVNYSNGDIESRGLATAFLYDPTQMTMTSFVAAPMENRVARPHAVFYNGTIYVAGGINDVDDPTNPTAPDTILNDFMVYDTANMNWKDSANALVAAIPEPSMGGGFAAIGNLMFLAPGLTCATGSTCSALTDYTASNKLHIYDPTTDEWDHAAQPSRPTARSFFATVSDGNRMYLIGGSDGTNALTTVEIFDPANGWTTSTPLQAAVVDSKAAISGGRIYVFGGRVGLFAGSTPIPYVQTIDLSTHQTLIIGETFESLVGQAPVQLRTPGPFLLFGAQEFVSTSTNPMADSDVVQFTVPQ